MNNFKPRQQVVRLSESEVYMVIDAYWVIFRRGTSVFVYDEIKDRSITKHCKKFDTEKQAEKYISEFMEEWNPKVAILDRI